MRRAVIIQARTASTRLPAKVLLPLSGRSLLARMIDRVRQATTPCTLVIATTTDPKDDVIESIARDERAIVFRGHPTDCLARHFHAASAVGADVVAKVPSDCPLIDPRVIDDAFATFDRGGWDYVSNLHPATYPDGMDVEVLPIRVLTEAHIEAERPLEREHTTPFVWDQPRRYRVANFAMPGGETWTDRIRLTIDYPEDYRVIERVFAMLHREGEPAFTAEDIVRLFRAHPEIFAENAIHLGVNWYRHHLGELRTIHETENMQ
jgi:spore coat polysaccharide biosynthesis protein SpsF